MRPAIRAAGLVCCCVIMPLWHVVQVGAETTTAPASPPRMLTREIRYHMPEAGEVWLVWGVNGWHRLPEAAWPPGTVLGKTGLMTTRMIEQGDAFVATVAVPNGTALDYCFLLTKKREAFDITWPLCEGNYSEVATRSGVTEIGSRLSLAVVTQEFHYHMPDAQEVSMVWGVNGWSPVPESLRPLNTKMSDNLMVSPMRKREQEFIVSVQVPVGATIDFGFRITRSAMGSVNIWEGGGAEGFHEPVRGGSSIRVKSNAIILPRGRPSRDEDNGWHVAWAIVGAVSAPLLLAGLLVMLRRRQARQRSANPFNPRREKPSSALDGLLILAAVGIGAFGAEQMLRNVYPHEGFGIAAEDEWFRQAPYSANQLFTIDPTLGIRPWLRTGRYTEYGTVPNMYRLAKDSRHTRILFVGNTVTYEGTLLHALRELHGEDRFEYWNAGVPTFNTVQQIAYYHAYNARTAPDHVILTIQPDDLGTIPIVFRNHTAELEVHRPAIPRKDLDTELYGSSYLYRYVKGLLISPEEKLHRLWQEYRDSVKSFSERLAHDHIRLSVVVLPVLASQQEWTQAERDRRQALFSVLTELQIEHYDLAQAFEPGRAENAVLPPMSKESWAPSSEMVSAFAQYMTHEGLFRTKEH
ncbi:MAG TPA: hypothetical protein PLY42_11815 [Nitrospira sp.]|nr:hypothetical protein [Nitrospira sp.]MCW5795302.1 hypothetical protein [Nitrospira sp.]HMU30621.1 hypothetical protein [Nitrospira sp.]HMW87111.1 hypothetical protein [Nitrospira sp.]HMX92049.1 hypothetical protein [Nitrospira sp.]